MEEIGGALSEYYAELEPDERVKLLDAVPEDTDWPLDFCRRVFRLRHTDPKHPEHQVDNWLWKCVYLPGLYQRRKSLKKQVRREAGELLRDLLLDGSEPLGEGERAALYWEFRNTARRYLSTCKSGRYAAKFLGIKKASEREKKEKACREIWQMSRGIARAAGQEEALSLWCGAFRAALLEFDPALEARYEELEATEKV